MCRLQNGSTELCVTALRFISTLNADLNYLPNALTVLHTNFRTKNSFNHIQRLHTMVYAYGATVIEIVRRKEFGKGKHGSFLFVFTNFFQHGSFTKERRLFLKSWLNLREFTSIIEI